MSWSVVILAGSRAGADPVARAEGVAHKAFVEIGGRAMIAHPLAALAALREEGRIGRLAVSLAPDAPAAPADCERLAADPSPSLSVAAAFRALGPPLLVATADAVFLTPAMLRRFLDEAERGGADLAAAVATRATIETAGDAPARTYLRFRDAEISGCNLFALTTRRAEGAIRLWRRVETHRKHPLRMARQIGPRTLARFATGRLTLDQALSAFSRRAGCAAMIVDMPFADAAHDVDKPDDLAFARARLG